jgi:transposase
MFGQGGPVKVFVAVRPVDFRKGIDGPALAVQAMSGPDPCLTGAVLVFRPKRADRIRLLVRDQTGMVLVHERRGRRQVRLAPGAGRGEGRWYR